ncbi:hypothetical protein P8452_52324 [Trifolium repens]|nr:hypothetical protein P8452_52324 [Trifolium repens]
MKFPQHNNIILIFLYTLTLIFLSTMFPVTRTIALHSSSLCKVSSDKPSSPSPTNLTHKPKSLLQSNPLYTPTQEKLSLQFKEKILCLEVMGIDSGKALSQNPNLHTATLESIHSIKKMGNV